MLYRIESQAGRCPCGGVSEKWTLFAGGRHLALITFCPVCRPRLAALVGHPTAPIHQGKGAGAE